MATKQKKVKAPNWSKAQQALQKVSEQLDQEESKLKGAGCFEEAQSHLHAAIRSQVQGLSCSLAAHEKLHDLPPPEESQQKAAKTSKSNGGNGGNGSSGEGGGEQQPQKPQQ
jgi:hypothetical protein